jgi:hypothetical protein
MKDRLLDPVILSLAIASLFPIWAASHVDFEQLGDDALITLTYAKNIARGDGFVFNHPPPVLGTTTPLFALATALLSRIFSFADLTVVAVFFSTACWIGLVWCWFVFRRQFRLSDWQAAIVGLVVAASGWVRHLDMEAYLFALLLVVASGMFFQGRLVMSGVAAGLLFLTRGEGVLLFGLLLSMTLWRDVRHHDRGDGRQPRSSTPLLCVGFAAPVLCWSLYAQLTFGGVLPNTLSAKIAQGASGLWQPFFGQLVEVWMPRWGRHLGAPGVPYLNLWYLLVLVGLAVVVWRKRPLLVVVGWVAAYVVGYSALAVAGYPWYALPVYFVLTVLVGVGLGEISAALANHQAKPTMGRVAAAAIVTLIVVRLGMPTVHAALHPVNSPRHTAYRELAQWLRDNTDADASVAYHEVGYLGYYTDNKTIDLVGLITPEITANIAIGDFGSGFWASLPDYLVQLEGSRFFDGIVLDPRFLGLYRQVAELPGFDGNRLFVYQRTTGR